MSTYPWFRAEDGRWMNLQRVRWIGQRDIFQNDQPVWILAFNGRVGEGGDWVSITDSDRGRIEKMLGSRRS